MCLGGGKVGGKTIWDLNKVIDGAVWVILYLIQF